MIIFDDGDIKILKIDTKYYLGFEDGGHMSRYWEIEISQEDAERVIQDVQNALQIVWDYNNKRWGLV